MSDNYDFEDIFKPRSIPSKDKEIIDMYKFNPIKIKNDPRTKFEVVRTCANCKYAIFPHSKYRGFCKLASIKKIKNEGIKVKIEYTATFAIKNERFVDNNWAHIYIYTHCDEHKFKKINIINMAKRWMES